MNATYILMLNPSSGLIKFNWPIKPYITIFETKEPLTDSLIGQQIFLVLAEGNEYYLNHLSQIDFIVLQRFPNNITGKVKWYLKNVTMGNLECDWQITKKIENNLPVYLTHENEVVRNYVSKLLSFS